MVSESSAAGGPSDRPADELAVQAAYAELRRLARAVLRGERIAHTLPPTALAHEAWLRLGSAGAPRFGSDGEFLAAAITTLRRILVEHGRRRLAQKRGGGRARADLDPDQLAAPVADERLLQLDEALQQLAAFDPAKARLVELRFFAGLAVDEAAAVLGVSPRTAARDWRLARAFLRTALGAAAADDLDG